MKAINGALKDWNPKQLMDSVIKRRESLYVEVENGEDMYYISIHADGLFVPVNDETMWYADIVKETNGEQERIYGDFCNGQLAHQLVMALEQFKKETVGSSVDGEFSGWMGYTITDWNIAEMTGYQPKTTFYTDLSIADRFGKDAIIDTYHNVMENWSQDVEFITEFCMALNWKIYEHYEKNPELAKLYDRLWGECDRWCMSNLKGDDLRYFIRTTD